MLKKILILDAHPVYILKTEGFLRGLTYNNITLARTAKEGLEKTGLLQPDLIIMSAMLPDMDAHEVCQKLKQQCNSSKIIVQIGLYTEQKDIEQFKQEGANAVLERKEKDLIPLEEAVAALLHSHNSPLTQT